MSNTPRDNKNAQTVARTRASRSKALSPLSAEEIAQRTQRQLPGIARATQDSNTGDEATLMAVEQETVARTADPDRDRDATADTSTIPAGPAPGLQVTSAGPRQMTIWEDTEDTQVIADWVAVSTRAPISPDHVGDEAGPDEEEAGRPRPTWRIHSAHGRPDIATRRARLLTVTTRDDLHQIQRVRPAVLDLVLEHWYASEETDRRLMALAIRFGVWSLTRTSDGEFNPYRDLTEDRITGFVRDAQVSVGSTSTYAAALRRLAAGPVNKHRGARRHGAEPLPRRVEDGLWAAADAFAPTSWRHQEAKTLLALSFGAGALANEINHVAPEDVLLVTATDGLRVRVRLLRNKTWVRDVPVMEPRYADWLAGRAAQLSGQTYLLKPERTSRRNNLNDTTRLLAEANQTFERFTITAARNTWGARWLHAGVPFPAWAVAAGIGPGTHLPADLLAHIATPDPDEVDDAFRRIAGLKKN